MSHFTVLVIGPDFEKQLAPFHEFECTGLDNEYVVEVDKTEELRQAYLARVQDMYVSPEGERTSIYDDRFFRDPTPEELEDLGPMFGSGRIRGKFYYSKDWEDGLPYRAKVRFKPDGYEEIKVPVPETQTFIEWVQEDYAWELLKPGEERQEDHKYGFIEVDETGNMVRCVKRTNPSAKWDWYLVGGRWRGFFPLKAGIEYDEDCLGDPGTFESINMRDGKSPDRDYEADRRVDHALLSQIDFTRARTEEETQARERFIKWKNIFQAHGKPLPFSSFWETALARISESQDPILSGKIREEHRENYNRQPAIVAAKEARLTGECPVTAFGFDEEEYVRKCRDRVLVPFAIVKDGKWFARGEMGWWAVVHDEKSTEKWNEEVNRLYDDLPPNTEVTLVDCHT